MLLESREGSLVEGWPRGGKRSSRHTVDRKRDIDHSKHNEDGIAVLLDHRNMLLRNAKDGCHLLPSQTSMSHEDKDTENVEVGPEISSTIEELVLETVDVTNRHRSDILICRPEEVEMRQAICADQHWRRTDVVLHCVTETELKEVDGHESAKHHP